MTHQPTSSHVIEGDPSSWKTSYVENATNLFNKDVPVCVKGGPDGAQLFSNAEIEEDARSCWHMEQAKIDAVLKAMGVIA